MIDLISHIIRNDNRKRKFKEYIYHYYGFCPTSFVIDSMGYKTHPYDRPYSYVATNREISIRFTNDGRVQLQGDEEPKFDSNFINFMSSVLADETTGYPVVYKSIKYNIEEVINAKRRELDLAKTRDLAMVDTIFGRDGGHKTGRT